MKKTHIYSSTILIIILVISSMAIVNLAASDQPHGVISLTFDDGWQTQYDRAFPLMQARGMTGTFYVITDKIRDYSSNTNVMTLAELHTLQNYGFEIGSHSKTHTSLTTLTDAQIVTECSVSKQVLQSNGFTAENFAFPWGAYNDHVDSIVNQYYRSARDVWNPNRTTPLPTSQFIVDAMPGETGKPDVLSYLKGIVDLAYSRNQWAVFFFHNIVTGTSDSSSAIGLQDFTGFLDYIVAKGIPTVTVHQALQLTTPPSPSPTVTPVPTPAPTVTPSPTQPPGTKTSIPITTATASSYNGITYGPLKAIDGIESTSNYWGTWSGSGLPQWLKLDLGTTNSFNQVVTHFYDGDARVYTYYIETSTDGNTWTNIVPTKTGTSTITDTFSTATGRYVRITVTSDTANTAAHIEEIKVFKSA